MLLMLTCFSIALDGEELGRVNEACDIGLSLDGARNRILDYVQSRMAFLAPNVTHVCGASTAARIMGTTRWIRYKQQWQSSWF